MGLLLMNRFAMFGKLHTDSGIVVKRLLPMLRVFRAVNWLMEAGMPVNRFPWIYRAVI